MSDDRSRCGQCEGACITGGRSCLAHAEPGERAAALKQFSESGDLDVRGVTISDALLQEIFGAASQDADGRPKFSAIQFGGATFEGAAEFGGATFEGDAEFGGATFNGDAWFGAATFNGDTGFSGAAFNGGAWFETATFNGDAGFSGATFEGDAGFGRATFKRTAGFDAATFNGNTGFDGATFEGDAVFVAATFNFGGGFRQATFKRTAGFDAATFKATAVFNPATFEADAGFDGATFEGDAWFDGATFNGTAGFGASDAGFGPATFKRIARFGRATFNGDARFNGVAFNGDAAFGTAAFNRDAGFGRAAFNGHAVFGMAAFNGDARFNGATFEGDAWFEGATFNGRAWFGWAAFNGGAWFSEATFNGDAWFGEATFKSHVPVLGPIRTEKWLDLDGVQFASAVRIEADAGVLTCRRGRLPGGGRFEVRRAVVRLDNSDLSAPTLLTGPPVSDPAGITGRPRLLSLQGANVAGLTLGNVSLADCRFAGAHNLDKLRLEADAVFGRSPAVAGWERRQVIAEETAWRAGQGRTWPGRWEIPPWPCFDDEPKPLSPGAISGLYRALRKGREDTKDEPGAADFYYGEMEMRRHDRGTGSTNKWRGRASRIVLTAYWLVSGYGLRAWRSLAALAVVMAVFAAFFRLWGFAHPISYWKSLLFAFRSTISLTDPSVSLTAWGGFLQACLRLTGPVLLALMLLALRARVKR